MSVHLMRALQPATWPIALTGALVATITCMAQTPSPNAASPKPVPSATAAAGAVKTPPNSGQTFAPAQGDSVLVAFPAGQVPAPYVTGGLYNSSQPPPVSNSQP